MENDITKRSYTFFIENYNENAYFYKIFYLLF